METIIIESESIFSLYVIIICFGARHCGSIYKVIQHWVKISKKQCYGCQGMVNRFAIAFHWVNWMS